MTGEDEEEEDAEENSASDDDDDEDDDEVVEMEDEEDAEETSCNTPTTVRRASPVPPSVDEVTSKLRRPFYSEWLKGGQNSKSSSDDKERDRESVV